MKAEIKQQWLEALRSGRYKQGQNRLRSKEDEFCCLGVLCDVVDPKAWERKGSDDAGYFSHGFQSYFPSHIGNQIGLPDRETSEPMSMNDNGKSFAEIADWIEANIPADA